MKLFYKKDYEELAEQKKVLISNYQNLFRKYCELDFENNHLKLKLKKELGAKGGLTAKNNKLKLENETLKQENESLIIKLKESMSDKYLVKKLRPQRTPKTLKTHLKSNAKTSSIVKKIYE